MLGFQLLRQRIAFVLFRHSLAGGNPVFARFYGCPIKEFGHDVFSPDSSDLQYNKDRYPLYIEMLNAMIIEVRGRDGSVSMRDELNIIKLTQ